MMDGGEIRLPSRLGFIIMIVGCIAYPFINESIIPSLSSPMGAES